MNMLMANTQLKVAEHVFQTMLRSFVKIVLYKVLIYHILNNTIQKIRVTKSVSI